jgi:uncharacterized protein (DUF427 family)
VATDVIWNYPHPFVDCVEVTNLVAFYWDKMDAWFEEDQQVFIGPKDPYTRVDSRVTSRHVEVTINGELVADTTQSIMLLETGQPHRYYIPKSDIRMELLRATDRVMESPYKGTATYYNVEAGGSTADLVAWCYEDATEECAKIADHICFPQGKVQMSVDGTLQVKPASRWD